MCKCGVLESSALAFEVSCLENPFTINKWIIEDINHTCLMLLKVILFEKLPQSLTIDWLFV